MSGQASENSGRGQPASGRTTVAQVIEATTGGTRRHLLDLVTGLDPARFAVSVIGSPRRDPVFASDVEGLRLRGIGVTLVPMKREISPLSDLLACLRIYRQLRRSPVEIVHTHSSKAGFLGRIAARLAGVRAVVHTPHVFPFQMDVGAWRKSFYLQLERSATRLADRVICIYPGQKQEAVAAGLGPPEKFVVIENGVRSNAAAGDDPGVRRELRKRLRIGEDQPVVGSLGRFTRQKGYEFLVHAARLLAQSVDGLKRVTDLQAGFGGGNRS